MEARIGFLVHGLHARRIVDVGDGRNIGALHVQLLPMLIMMCMFGGLVVLTPGSAVAPFIYALFKFRRASGRLQ